MSAFELNLLHALHVASIVLLLAYTFYGFAAAPETRRGVMITTGIATLVAFLTGIRMWQGMFGFSMALWVIVKLVCWIGLSALAGIGYRKRENPGTMMGLILVLAVVAVFMVYFKPTL